MEFNVLFVILAIVFVIAIFSASYYWILTRRYKKESHLILSRHYLDQLFRKSSNPLEASQGSNGDIIVEIVTFEKKDFCFSFELGKIVEFFQSIENQE